MIESMGRLAGSGHHGSENQRREMVDVLVEGDLSARFVVPFPVPGDFEPTDGVLVGGVDGARGCRCGGADSAAGMHVNTAHGGDDSLFV